LKTHTSATIRIAGKNVCVRDGGVWKDCREVLSLGGGDVTLGLEKLIDKEWKKGPPGRVHRTSVRYANRLVVLANWSMGLSSILAAESLSTILFFWRDILACFLSSIVPERIRFWCMAGHSSIADIV
jgi:hypothetical protein